MGVTNSNKELSVAKINCGDSFNITLSLTAEPNIAANPADIVLVLDRSRSMAGGALANLKNGAKKFIDIIDESTDGAKDGNIGLGSHIGIVSFASTATQDTQLITSVEELKAAVDALSADGSTNHEDAFKKAVELFNPMSTNEKIIVMFTDGKTTAGGDPTPITEAAKAQGIIIYCIGLSGNGGIDEQALKDWASDPASAYVAITPNDEELEKIFEDLAKNISKPGATKIVIDEKVTSCFEIVSVEKPSKGTASITDSRSLQWKIDELGVKGSEGAQLIFTVRHIGPCSGTVEVNDELNYSDHENNAVTFPSPEITVECETVVTAEGCPKPIDIKVDGCEDSVEINAGNVVMTSLGRIIQLDLTLQNVCPHKRVALAVILTEVDEHKIEHSRGVKTITVPAHQSSGCRNVTVRCINFVVPEDLDVSGSPSPSICNERKFKARFIAHYIDTDFVCCNAVTAIP